MTTLAPHLGLPRALVADRSVFWVEAGEDALFEMPKSSVVVHKRVLNFGDADDARDASLLVAEVRATLARSRLFI